MHLFYVQPLKKQTARRVRDEPFYFGGSGEIRTHDGFPHAGFQDRCIRPLCHFSAAKILLLRKIATQYVKYLENIYALFYLDVV